MFTTALTNSSDSLVSNAHLLTKVYFPRAVIPAAAVIPAMADFLVGFLLMAPVLLIFGVPLRPTLLLAPFIALLAPLAALAVGLWVSAVNARYRDVRYAVPFFIQLFVFVTPVFYPPELVPARYAPYHALNPMAAVVESFRAAVLGTPIPAARLAIAAVIIAVLIVTGFAWFRRLERGIADVV
jgi:lipopolysaccharide transport system permease protein